MGAVRFVATGQPESVVWCHCESCRKHSGAPVSVFVAFKRNAYVVTERQITKFNSSPGRWRGFCARCSPSGVAVFVFGSLTACSQLVNYAR